MNINNRQKLLTILAAAVIVFWLGDKLVLSPLTKTWKEHSERIKELRNLIAQGNQTMARERTVFSKWDSMRTNTFANETSVAEDQLLKAFERWSQDSRISITSIRPQWRRNADDYMTLECRADAFGSMQTLTRFIYDVEKDPMALKVEVVEITSHDNDGQQLSLGLQVSGLVLNPPPEQ
ncbi:MAG TPA: hypothetical protein VGE41_05325 [Verrucomicrobiae bacterium]|jgi:Tfp pilus assembly protein PilO